MIFFPSFFFFFLLFFFFQYYCLFTSRILSMADPPPSLKECDTCKSFKTQHIKTTFYVQQLLTTNKCLKEVNDQLVIQNNALVADVSSYLQHIANVQRDHDDTKSELVKAHIDVKASNEAFQMLQSKYMEANLQLAMLTKMGSPTGLDNIHHQHLIYKLDNTRPLDPCPDDTPTTSLDPYPDNTPTTSLDPCEDDTPTTSLDPCEDNTSPSPLDPCEDDTPHASPLLNCDPPPLDTKSPRPKWWQWLGAGLVFLFLVFHG
jgi:hypothetical protein